MFLSKRVFWVKFIRFQIRFRKVSTGTGNLYWTSGCLNFLSTFFYMGDRRLWNVELQYNGNYYNYYRKI